MWVFVLYWDILQGSDTQDSYPGRSPAAEQGDPLHLMSTLPRWGAHNNFSLCPGAPDEYPSPRTERQLPGGRDDWRELGAPAAGGRTPATPAQGGRQRRGPRRGRGALGGEWPCRASPINSPRRGGGGRSPRSRRRRSRRRRRRSGSGHSQHRGQRPHWAPPHPHHDGGDAPAGRGDLGRPVLRDLAPLRLRRWLLSPSRVGGGRPAGGVRGGGWGSHHSLAAIPQLARPHGWGWGRARSTGAAPQGERGLETSLAALKSGESLEGAVTTSVTLFVVGNGYMDGKELQNFIQELQQARKKAGLVG